MSEIRRIYRRRTVLFLLVLSVVNFALFLFAAAPDKEITLSGDALSDYIGSYPAFLEQTAENSRVLATLNMYRSGYACDMLRKSASAYAALEGTVPEEGDNRGIVLLLQYRISDIFLLAFLLIMTVDFLAERKKGLAGLVRSCLKGRGSLYIKRVAILACSAFLGAFFLYGGNFLGMLLTFRGSDMSRCIQSLPEFMKCPYRISIGGYFLFSVLLKVLGALAAALVFLILISILGANSAYAVMGGLTVLEIALHLLIAPVSSLNILRYFNLYTIIDCEEFFTDYCFADIFGTAVPALAGAVGFLGAALLVLTGLGLYIHGKMYVFDKKIGERTVNRLAARLERVALQRSLAGWEIYKTFIKQGALLVIAAVFMLHFSMSAKYDYFYAVDTYEMFWYERFEGELTEEKLADAEMQLAIQAERIARYEKTLDELRRQVPVDEDKVFRLSITLAEAVSMRDGLLPVLENMRQGMEYTRQTGNTIEVIEPFAYDLLLQRDEKTRNRAGFLILIGIIGAVSGVFAYEAENHMKDPIRTAYRGRGRTAAVKLGVVFAVCALTAVSVHLIQIYQIGADLEFNNITAPVQSLPFMRGFGPYISILEYLTVLFVIRVFVAYGIGLICAGVSRMCADTVTAVGICAFLFVVPAVLGEVIPGAEACSAIHWLGGSYFTGGKFAAGEVYRTASRAAVFNKF